MPDKPLKPNRPQTGPAVDDEDPDASPMTGLATPTGPARPYDVEKVENDRARSQGPKTGETDKG